MKLEVNPIFSPVKLTFEDQKELDHLISILSAYLINLKSQKEDTVDFTYFLLNSIKNRVK